MAARREGRTTIGVGDDLIQAIRERAQSEGRGFNDLVADAFRLYLSAAPSNLPEAGPSLAAPVQGAAELLREVQTLTAAVRQALPRIDAVAQGQLEVLDTLDAITTEIGRRRGAALALEQVAAINRPASSSPKRS